MPVRVAEKPGGVVDRQRGEVLVAVVAVEVEREGRMRAGRVARSTPAWKLGSKGRRCPGRARRSGPESSVKNWVEVWCRQARVPGRECAWSPGRCRTGSGVARSPRSEPKKCMLNAVSGLCGRSLKVIVSCPVCRVGGDGAGELDVGREAVGDEEDPVAVAGQRLAEVDEPGQRRRAAPSCRSRGCRPSRTPGTGLLPRCRSSPRHPCRTVLPSAALGLIEKPRAG